MTKEAESDLVRAYALERANLGGDDVDTLHIRAKFADVYRETDQLEEAQAIALEVLQDRRRLFGDDHRFTLVSRNNLGLILLAQGRPDEALRQIDEAVRRATIQLGVDSATTLSYRHNRAIALVKLKRFPEAFELFEECLEKRRNILVPDHLNTLRTLHYSAEALMGLGRFDEARERLESITPKLGPDLPPLHSFRGLVLLSLGRCYGSLGRDQEAEASLRAAHDLLRRRQANHRYTREAATALDELKRKLSSRAPEPASTGSPGRAQTAPLDPFDPR